MSRNKTGLTCSLEEVRTLESKIEKQKPSNTFIQIPFSWIISFSLSLSLYMCVYTYKRREQEKMSVITLAAIYLFNLAAPRSHEIARVKYDYFVCLFS